MEDEGTKISEKKGESPSAREEDEPLSEKSIWCTKPNSFDGFEVISTDEVLEPFNIFASMVVLRSSFLCGTTDNKCSMLKDLTLCILELYFRIIVANSYFSKVGL